MIACGGGYYLYCRRPPGFAEHAVRRVRMTQRGDGAISFERK